MVKQKKQKGVREMISKKVLNFNEIQQSNEKVTSQAGLMMYDYLMKSIKLDEVVNKHMPKPGSNSGFKPFKYVEAISLMQYGGGGDINDLAEIREDNALLESCSINKIPSDSAAGDWLGRMGKGSGVHDMKKVNEEIIKKIIKNDAGKEYTLVSDPTIIDLKDKEYAEMIYNGVEGDRPILVSLLELPIFAGYKYRKGNAMGGARESIESGFKIVNECGKKIKHCSLDSEYYNSEVVNYIESENCTYTIAADKDAGVMSVINSIPDNKWKHHYNKHGEKTDREIALTLHSMTKTKVFMLAVMRWKNKKEQMSIFDSNYFYHAIATNLEVDEDKEIEVDKIKVPEVCSVVWKYNERVGMENMIKELKTGIGLEHMPCREFEANAMYFGIGILTYNLFILQKYFVIKDGLERKTISTIRWKLVHIAGWIVKHGNRIIFKISSTLDKYKHYLRMIKRIEAFSKLSTR